MQLTRILREGFIAGLIGAAAVALWFLIVDVIAGRPFFTPAMLGSAVFWGVHDPAQVVIAFSRVLPYTMIHICAFIIVGTVAAALAAEVEVAPPTLYLIVVSFAVFEFGFYIMLAVLAQPLLGALAWWNVAIGNAIAAYGMGYYLWREHPKIKEALRVHPLGETDEGEESRPPAAPPLPRQRTLPARSTGTTPRPPPPTGGPSPPPTPTGRRAADRPRPSGATR